jgi:hypothetical protein
MNTMVKVVSRAQTNRLTLPPRPKASLFQAQDSFLKRPSPQTEAE